MIVNYLFQLVRVRMNNFLWALTFLTVIPIRSKNEQGFQRTGTVACWFPVVGLCIGVFLSICSVLFSAFFPPFIAYALVLVAYIATTGALHLDGLADTCDGIWGGKDKEARLSIMKDSRIGSFGAIGLISLLGIKYAGLAGIGDIAASGHALYAVILTKLSVPISPLSANVIPALLVMPVMGRWSQVFAAALLPYARSKSGTGSFIVEETTAWHVLCATLLPLCLLWFFYASLGFVLFAIIVVFVLVWIWHIKKKIGGMTGDTLGATNELVELLFLLSLLATFKI